MKKLLIAILVMTGMSQAADIGIVVKDNTSRSTVGVDTLLGDFLAATLGKTVDYRDLDSAFTPATWDGYGYDFVLFVGSNVSGAGAAWNLATANADSVAKSNTPFICIGNAFWDEINLGTAAQTQAENTGYIINIGQNHWITKVLQDTVVYWTTQATDNFTITIPDTLHEVKVLLVDKDSKADTGAAILAVCDVGDTIINTGDGRNVANQRRAFFGSWQFQAVPMDSCQFYTILARTAAWVSTDTANAGVMSPFCFSGAKEIVGSYVVENSSGTDSIEVYGGYNNMYTGIDFDQKHFFIKPSPLAVQRKLGNIYRSATLGSIRLSMMLKAKAWDATAWEGGIVPTTYSSSICLAPIIRYWRGQSWGIGYFDSTFAYACWTYRYGDNVSGVFTPYAWSMGGAQDEGVDHVANYLDTLVISEASALNTRYWIDLDTVVTGAQLLDSSLFQGWVANTIAATYTGPGVECGFYSVINSLDTRPYITGLLSTYSTTSPTPTIATSADSIVFTGIYGQTIPVQYLQVTNSGGGALECASITDDGGWLTPIVESSNTPLTVILAVTAQEVGYTSATLTIVCADASNTPKTVKVVRNLTAATSRSARGAIEIR